MVCAQDLSAPWCVVATTVTVDDARDLVAEPLRTALRDAARDVVTGAGLALLREH